MIIIRYADDAVVGFQYQHDAERFLTALQELLATFALRLHPEKTRLIEFGRSLLLDSGVLSFHAVHKSPLIYKVIEKEWL